MDTSPDFDPGLDPRSVATALEEGFAHFEGGDRRRLAEELLVIGDRVNPLAAVAVGIVASTRGSDAPVDERVQALADRTSPLLPDAEAFRDASEAVADGELEPLLGVLEAYHENDQYRDRLDERTLEDPFDGSATSLAAARETFDADTTEAALLAIRDVAWLLTASDLQETATEQFVADADRSEPPAEWERRRRESLERAERTYDDVATELESALYGDLERQGFVRLNPLYFARASPPDPETCWRTGFDLKAVKEGYAYERTQVVGDLLESLRAGESRLVVGRAGSGKSTICKSIACRWYERGHGTVLYRSSWAEADFEDPEPLLSHVLEADGHALVVIEDAIRYPNEEVFETIESVVESRDGSVSFLLEARRGELDGLDRQLGDDQGNLAATIQRLRGPVLVDYEVPGLVDEECVEMVEHFESITGTEVVESTEALLDRTRRNQGVGGDDVIHFAYHLVRSTEGFETGLEKNVEAVYDRLENPDGTLLPYGDLPARVALAVNVLKAANVPVHRELLYTLSDDYEALEAVIEELTGELLFESPDSTALKTNHELWASLYVRMLMEKADEATAHRRFAECVNAIFSIFEPETRREIERQFDRHQDDADGEDENEVAATNVIGSGTDERSYLSAVLPAAKVVDKIADLGRRWPVLAPLYGNSDDSKLALPSVCSTMTVANFIAARGDMYLNSGDPDCAKAEYRTAQELVEESNTINERLTRKMESIYYNNIGDVAANRGDVEEARDYYGRGLEISRDIRYRVGEAKSLTNLGTVNWSLDEHERAVDHYERALEIYREIGDHHEGARCLKNLGLVAWGRGDYEEADRFLDRSVAIYREIGDRLGEAGCLNNRGLVAQDVGNIEKADEWYRRSLEIYREIGDRYGESIALSNIGSIAFEQGKVEEAERYHSRSLEIARDVDDQFGEAACLDNLGRVAFERGNFDDAEELFRRSKELCEETANLAGLGDALRDLGILARERGEIAEAESFHEQAREQFDELNRPTERAKCLHDLGKDARAREDYRTALEYFEQACGLYLELGTAHRGVEVLSDLLAVCEQLGDDEKRAEWCSRGTEFAESVGREEVLAGYCGD